MVKKNNIVSGEDVQPVVNVGLIGH